MSPEFQKEPVVNVWQDVANLLKQATTETITLSEQQLAALDENFWGAHTSIYEQQSPEVREAIFQRFEELGLQPIEQIDDKAVERALRKTKITAYLRAFIGLPMTYAEMVKHTEVHITRR